MAQRTVKVNEKLAPVSLRIIPVREKQIHTLALVRRLRHPSACVPEHDSDLPQRHSQFVLTDVRLLPDPVEQEVAVLPGAVLIQRPTGQRDVAPTRRTHFFDFSGKLDRFLLGPHSVSHSVSVTRSAS